MTNISASGDGITQTQRTPALPAAPAQGGLVLTSTDPTLGQGASWQPPQAVQTATPVIQALGNVTGTVTLAVASAYVTDASLTLTGNTVLQITGMPAGGLVRLSVTQDGTGNHTFAVGNPTTTSSVYVEQAAAFTSKIRVFSVDGGTMEIEGPPLVGRSWVVTATNTTWPIPSPATKMTIAAVGSGGSGGGGGSPAAGVNQSGGSGGGPGFASIQEDLDVSTISTLNVTIGGAVNGGAGGVAGGNDGVDGGFGVSTTVTGTGISVTGRGGLKGVHSAAGATTATQVIYNPNGATWGNGGMPLMGGTAGASGAGLAGGVPVGYSPGGGGGGMSATATLGGGAGSPGTATAGGAGGSVLSGTTAGVNATAATALAAGGGGGGGGANGGAGGNGGASGAGFAVLTVTEAASITLPNPSQSMIFDGRVASGASTQVVYSGSSVTLQGWNFIQAGLTNPSNGTPPNGNARVELMAPFGPWAAKTHKVMRFRNWNTDTNNKNGGQQKNPAASGSSPGLLGNYALGQANWHVFFGFSVMLPDGNARDDLVFPVIPSWSLIFEDFGPPFTGGPVWGLGIVAGNTLNRPGNPVLTSGVNYFYILSGFAPQYAPYWTSSAPLLYGDSNKYDFVYEVGRSTVASTDGGITGGFVNQWVNGVQQTWLPGVSEGGTAGAQWTRANAGKTLIIPTLGPSDSTGPGFGNWTLYRGVSQFSGEGTANAPLNNPAIDPITMYMYIVGIGTTFNSVDPATN